MSGPPQLTNGCQAAIMGTIQVSCDFCGREFTVPSSMDGQALSCDCGSTVRVSSEATAEPSESPPPTEEGTGPTGDAPADGWYVHSNGASLGPIKLSDLRNRAKEGELNPQQRIYHASIGTWRRASHVPALEGCFPQRTRSSRSEAVTDMAGRRRWHVRVGEEKYGPFSSDRINQMIAKHQLQPTSQIWSQELGEWKPLREVKPFSDIWEDGEQESPPQKKTQKEGSAKEKSHTGPEKKESVEEHRTTQVNSSGRQKETSTGISPTRAEQEGTPSGLTQNLKRIFGGGDEQQSEHAHIPSTLLTVEYVDDSEGMETSLARITELLRELKQQTTRLDRSISRIAQAIDQQNKRSSHAMNALKRRVDELYNKMENAAISSRSDTDTPDDSEEPGAEEGFGVPEQFQGDEAHEHAWQIAQVVVDDLAEYHPEDVEEGVMYDNFREVLEAPIEEARKTYEERTPDTVRQEVDYFDMALRQLKSHKQQELGEDGSL